MQKRITELDSLRGLAALTVLSGHILNTFSPLPIILLYSPLRIFWAAHEAVILFFLLSGFVLTLPFLKTAKVNYGLYLLKRILRIYVPYIVAIFVSISLMRSAQQNALLNVRFIGDFWREDFGFSDIINHFLLIGNFDTDSVNPVIWSLVHEMRISIIFPFIVLLIFRLKWYHSFLLAIILSVTGTVISFLEVNVSRGYLNSYAHTVHYIAFFIIGSLLAINKDIIIRYVKKLNFKVQIVIVVLGIFIYTGQFGLGYFIKIDEVLFIREWVIAIGAVIFIIISISTNWASEILSKKSIKFLGEISYSLYLYHLPILMISFSMLYNMLPQLVIILIALPFVFLVSFLSFKFVEKNAIKYGQSLSGKWKNKDSSTLEKLKEH